MKYFIKTNVCHMSIQKNSIIKNKTTGCTYVIKSHNYKKVQLAAISVESFKIGPFDYSLDVIYLPNYEFIGIFNVETHTIDPVTTTTISN